MMNCQQKQSFSCALRIYALALHSELSASAIPRQGCLLIEALLAGREGGSPTNKSRDTYFVQDGPICCYSCIHQIVPQVRVRRTAKMEIIMWRWDKKEKIDVFLLDTIIFGTTLASIMARRSPTMSRFLVDFFDLFR
jgi:hypothetical protein